MDGTFVPGADAPEVEYVTVHEVNALIQQALAPYEHNAQDIDDASEELRRKLLFAENSLVPSQLPEIKRKIRHMVTHWVMTGGNWHGDQGHMQ